MDEIINEKLLIDQLKKGDKKAVNVWFNSYNSRLLKVVRTKISNSKDAEEIVQQTFLNCLKHLPLFLGKSSIWTWMNSIARHEVADYFRKKYAKKAIKTIPLSELLPLNEISESNEVSNKVNEVLSRMSKHYKEILLLKYADNKKVFEIAKELNRTVKSIESDLFRARNEFKQLWAIV